MTEVDERRCGRRSLGTYTASPESASQGVEAPTRSRITRTHGLPRIQAAYLLFDPETLALNAVLDGTALTTLRTPAVSVATVLERLPDRSLRAAVFGAGPQATDHVSTLAVVGQRPLPDTARRNQARITAGRQGVAVRRHHRLRRPRRGHRCSTPLCCATTPW